MKLSDPPRKLWFFLGLLAGAACLSVTTVSAQSGVEAQLQQQQDQIDALNARIRAMETYEHVSVTGEGKKMMVEPWPPLETFTRNFKWHTYTRAGAAFYGNGLGFTGSINLPGVGGRMRLGNENDFYWEGGPILTHLIGEDPDDIDVLFKMTLAAFNNVGKRAMNLNDGEFNFGVVETYIEMRNVIASAPETNFWAGLRYYDRYDIHPQDYFYVGTTGFGTGVTDWDVGIGKLNIAYFGAIEAGTGQFFIGPTAFTNYTFTADDGTASGDLYRHILDIRLGEIDFLGGNLKLLLEGAYQQGGPFTADGQTEASGNAKEAWGVGGGFIQTWAIPDDSFWGGNSSSFQMAILYGHGLVNFADQFSTQMGRLNSAYLAALERDDATEGTFEQINFYREQKHGTANIFWVWNPNDDFSMGTWATAVYDDQGFAPYFRTADNTLLKGSPNTWQFTGGIRPYLWLSGPFAIQGSAGYEYISHSRGGDTANGFDADGNLVVLTVAPTIKPRGGFWTRPELRIFATWATWSSDLKGQVGYNDPTKTSAWIFGFQGEIWF